MSDEIKLTTIEEVTKVVVQTLIDNSHKDLLAQFIHFHILFYGMYFSQNGLYRKLLDLITVLKDKELYDLYLPAAVIFVKKYYHTKSENSFTQVQNVMNNIVAIDAYRDEQLMRS